MKNQLENPHNPLQGGAFSTENKILLQVDTSYLLDSGVVFDSS